MTYLNYAVALSLALVPHLGTAFADGAMKSDQRPDHEVVRLSGEHEVLRCRVVVPGVDANGQPMDKEKMLVTFDFTESGGKPGVADPMANEDGSLIAVTNYPATQTAYTHLLLRQPNGDLLAMNSFQERVSRLVGADWRRETQDHLAVVGLRGREVSLEALRYAGSPNGIKHIEHKFVVVVTKDGEVSLKK